MRFRLIDDVLSGGPVHKVLNVPAPKIEVSRFLKDGVFVPAFFFEPPLLGFVPPGAEVPDTEPPSMFAWGGVFVTTALVVAFGSLLPVEYTRCLAYAAIAVPPLAFATSAAYSVAQVYVALSVAFFLTAFLADKNRPWYIAWAVVLAAGPLTLVDPAAAAVLAASGKVVLDHSVLTDHRSHEQYGLWRRWSTVGATFMTLTYGAAAYGWPSETEATVAGLVAVSVAVLVVCAYRFQHNGPREEVLTSFRPWAAMCSVVALGYGRGALLPHALAAQLVDNGLPAQAAGLVGLTSAIAEFAVLSYPNLCAADNLLTTGLVLSGIHMQVVCAVSGTNWLWLLPLSAILQGISSALVAMAVPRLAASFGGTRAQGALQGSELFGTAIAVVLWPSISGWAGRSFAYQTSAYMLIVIGILGLLLGETAAAPRARVQSGLNWLAGTPDISTKAPGADQTPPTEGKSPVARSALKGKEEP